MALNANSSPFLQTREPVNIAALFSADGITPVRRTLDIHLRNLYFSLSPVAGAAEIALGKMAVSYSYRIDDLPSLFVPLIFIPYFTVCVTATAQGTTLEELCKQQADACEAIISAQKPPTEQARLEFAFMLMSGTKETDRPLLEADNVYLSLADISVAS